MDIFQTLEFSQEWLELGIVDSGKLDKLESEWKSGEDRNTEHYRWRAFLDFMELQVSLDPTLAKQLYELGGRDADPGMGGSMMAHVLRRKDCTADLLRVAAESEKKFLRKIATEKMAQLSRNPAIQHDVGPERR